MGDEETNQSGSRMTIAPVESQDSPGQSIAQLGENLAALRDFVELIEPVLNERREAVMTDRARDLAPLLYALYEADPESFPEPPSDEVFSRVYGSEIRVDVSKDDDEPGRIGLNVSGNTRPFRLAVQELMRSGQHVTLLYRNALVSLVSYVEWFVSRLLHEHYASFPGSWQGDRCLSLRELEGIGTIEEARRFIIDQKVEEQLRASLEEWIKHFKSHLGLGLGYLDSGMDALLELFQRRNLTVHHGGIINSTYLSRVSASLTNGLKIGMPLPIDRSYVMSSIDHCDLCFTLIGKWQQRTDALAECLQDVDFDAKEPIFRFCLMALRDDLDELIKRIPAAVDRGDLEISYLEKWPIFKGLRGHVRYAEVMEGLTTQSNDLEDAPSA